MDGSNSNATELVEQLIDLSEKLLGYKSNKGAIKWAGVDVESTNGYFSQNRVEPDLKITN